MFYKTVVIIVLFASIIAIEGNTDRVLGGKNVDISEHAHQVSLQYDGNHFCGGSVYNNSIIITAAHCVDPFKATDLKYLSILLGTSSLTNGGIRIPWESFVKHQFYSNKTSNYDVALVKLKKPVTYTSSIQPITLAKKTPENGAQVFLTGWGLLKNGDSKPSQHLQGVPLDFISRAACGSHPNAYSSDSITSAMICAGADQKGSCNGDSGGPLVDLKTKSLLGVVSWGGKTCAAKGYPGVYANVPALASWIKSSADALSKN